MSDLLRELQFAWRESVVRLTILMVLVFTTLSLLVGTFEIRQQNSDLAELIAATEEDRSLALAGKTDPGDIAYYDFHLTYDPPTELAFIALGLRDEFAWKHRLRALALEGQIYETDEVNGELSLLGQLDFAYLVSVLLPLFVIGLLFDLSARERRDARFELLCATSGLGERLLLVRALARVVLVYIAVSLPFLGFAIFNGVTVGQILLVMMLILVNLAFWLLICRLAKRMEGVTAAVSLLSFWFVVSIVVPVSGKTIVEQVVSVPAGGDILLTQRETVNTAWDLPKAATMEPFLAAHPEWSDYSAIDRPFEWKWYYAFQEVGDQVAGPLSTDLYNGITLRDQAMGWVAMLSPTLMSERTLTELANTNVTAHLSYISCAREFHASLRHFYYPMLFGKVPYSDDEMSRAPEFRPCA